LSEGLRVGAVDKPPATGEELLAVFTVLENRLARLEEYSTDSEGSAFPADSRVLQEGESLRAQLAGVEGTEAIGPLFKDLQVQLATMNELHENTNALLEAINENTRATNDLLRASG
jgi:hypothetical protein